MAETDKDKDKTGKSDPTKDRAAPPDAGVAQLATALTQAFRTINPQADPPKAAGTTDTRRGGAYLVNDVWVDAEGRHLCDESGYPPESREEAMECKFVIDPNAPAIDDDAPQAVPRRTRSEPKPATLGAPQTGANVAPPSSSL